MNIKLIQTSIILLIFSLAPVSNAEKTIRLASGEWKPYISEELDNYGPYSQIISEAFALEGVRVEYRFYPWKRAVYLARTGQSDGSVAAVRTPEREKMFFYSNKPVFVTDRVFFYLKDTGFDWTNIDDLKNIRIGATQEYYYSHAFRKAENAGIITVERARNDSLNFRKLLRGRIDVFPVSREVGYSILKSEFGHEESKLVTHHPTPLTSSSFHVILSKKIVANEDTIEAFDKGLEKLKDSGRYTEIIGKLKK